MGSSIDNILEQKNLQLSEWFGGLFTASGSFCITKRGEMAVGHIKYSLSASIGIHISRQEIVRDLVELVGGRPLQKKDGYFNRVTWEARSFQDVAVVVALLEQAACPLPVIVSKQLDIAKRFLKTKMHPGRSKDIDLADEVCEERTQLWTEMRELTRWKRSLEYQKGVKNGKEDVGEPAEGV